jgi:cyclic beta-1,2-glucan synthetase
VSNNVFRDQFCKQFRAFLSRGHQLTVTPSGLPLRAELFNAEHMELHGRELAGLHRFNPMPAPNLLLDRLSDNARVIGEACRLLAAMPHENRQVTPAEEWLLDNFYLVDEQIRTAKRHFPKSYSRGLPRLVKGPSANLPRIYDIALEAVAHGDARLDSDTLIRFIATYQTVAPLRLGELWAFPIMLRLALIENLRRVAARLMVSRNQQNLADRWADRMTAMAEKDSESLILVIGDMARSNPPVEGAFVAEMARRLQGHGAGLALPLSWIEQHLARNGANIEQLVNAEIQQKAADQMSVSNSIGSLRFLGKTNWRDFVETLSLVDATLREDPAGAYSRMDFATRDLYRHAVETIAKKSSLDEEDIARRIVALARDNVTLKGHCDLASHVGYYLLGKGRGTFEKSVHFHPAVRDKLEKAAAGQPLLLYLGAIALLTGAVGSALVDKAYLGQLSHGVLALVTVAAVIGASHFAVAMVNWLVTMLARPHILPRLDFSDGVPAEARTMVVVPTLLTSVGGIDDLCEALEVRFLANSVEHLHFCLLTDFADSIVETLPLDHALVEHAKAGINALNVRYANGEDDLFFLFHRPRVWNAEEKTWMGYERKRGKLGALNAYLRGGSADAFSCITGKVGVLQQVRYVITLDTDTQLPRNTARELIGVMAHPLHRPQYDERTRRVVEGYGIIQPRVAATLPGTNASLYERLCGGEPGIDPYTRAISDVYQDAFSEGSFVGKGIYDVDAFHRTLEGRFPENRILSHDLVEGCYARSGLLSDVQLYEPYPARYDVDVSRRHRWVRGDWQLAAWLLPVVPGPEKKRLRNPLSALSRWKILDNLRRSVVPLALTLLLVLGWTLLSFPWFWTGAVIGILVIPSLCSSLLALTRKPAEVTMAQHVSTCRSSAGWQMAQSAFALATLPYDAFYQTDAILRASWRLIVSHKDLLEWTPSGEGGDATTLPAAFRTMWIAPALAIALAALIAFSHPAGLWAATPVLLLWLFSPAIVWRLSRPVVSRETSLDRNQVAFLRGVARKTWRFFETYVGAEDHWLPPDNVQEHPVFAIAHRTSPTNMGLSLLANLTAWDFGYISTDQLIERTDNALQAMEGMERYQGHFYNWYDTLTLVPMEPVYISTVDSGNLAGHLLTLRQGLLALADQPVADSRVFAGLRDTLDLLVAAMGGTVPEPLKTFDSLLSQTPGTPRPMLEVLRKLATDATEFEKSNAGEDEAVWWAAALARQCTAMLGGLDAVTPGTAIPTLREFAAVNPQAREKIKKLERMALQCDGLSRMAYDFLYDKSTHLLTIGYNVTDRRQDTGYYDLLASEERLGVFIAIAQGQIPQESWFALGRKLVRSGGKTVLLSWSGSMFEYLMPLLVMPPCKNTLLDQACRSAVQRQIEYGAQRGVPWGISESGYNMFDAHMNYQYHAFGVPGLGMKRGLADDLVIAPYASVMALMVAPKEACRNLQHLAVDGFEGRYGFFEAIDYTLSRVPRPKTHAVVQSFMAHHQGMSFLSLSYCLLNQPMQKRFECDPLFQATMLLLHEKIGRAASLHSYETKLSISAGVCSGPAVPSMRFLTTAATPVPEVQLLSNGRYHAMVSNAGGGSSRWKDLSLTRWRADATCDNWGTFCYIRDAESGLFWSTAHQPTLTIPKFYEAILSEGRAEFRRRDKDIETHTEIVVSPEDDIELRRSRITNRSRVRRIVEVTSYGEVVLAEQAADMAHPAFSDLFVQTEILPERHAILCTRRARYVNEQPPWMCHLMAVHGAASETISYETDRLKFIGRGNTAASPQALHDPGPLSDSQGSVLDPVVAIRCQVTLEPEQSVTIDVVTGAADSREICLALIDKYHDLHLADRVFEMAWSHSEAILRQLNVTASDAQLYCRLASCILYPNPALRADAATLIKNCRGQSALWSYAISGDLPIVLLKVRNIDKIELVRQMVQAHAYWRLKGLAVDLMIWNEDQGGYRQALQEQILALISAGTEAHAVDRPGGIFVRPGDQIAPEDRILMESVACAIIRDNDGPLAEQVRRIGAKVARMPRLIPAQSARTAGPVKNEKPPERTRVLFNGLGGFSPDGREYVIETGPGRRTPAPWSNVLANPNFGTVISETGQAYSWSENAHEFRLTPWNNDPVTDTGGEALYLRDEESGEFWSPSPAPAPGSGNYVTRHGFGYSVFEHMKNGIHSELTVYVAVDAPVKFSVIKIRNESGRSRKLSATGYVEWVLGDLRTKTGMHIITDIDQESGAVFARNAYNTDFAGRIAFFTVNDSSRSVTCDRREFIGRNGSLQHPSAMDRTLLSGKVGAALDPCAALQTLFELADGETREVIFKLGVAGRRLDEAAAFVRRFAGRAGARDALEAVRCHWSEILGAVQVRTPDPSLNILANGWLMYQTIACRLWARSGYYQSGGAFGFRDQLQDAMAVIHTRPQLLRDQLLLCAGHQFVEGDVQHWWHPPMDRGVRTKCSDDFLWLPLAACRYVTATGDTGVLQETMHFLEGRTLGLDEDSVYDLPGRSADSATLYEHCVRAIRHGLRFGVHGLPLMGSCDWNDGMDKVGEQSRGESVWLGFFLYDILLKFEGVARANGDADFADLCASEAVTLRQNIEKNAWDGGWYRRAYFDDGTPLGSASNPECQIDSLSQSWSVLSGAGDPERSRQAMEAVDKRLVRRDHGLIQLLDPPFDKSDMNPGYIRGYVPGVRENGGQYTHAAIWTAMAFARMEDGERAYELLQMINPVNHARTEAETALYKVEPYVVAADVYGVAPHVGRGGWTWYTGSAGWMYRLILESVLGLSREGDRLHIAPCLPAAWHSFAIDYKYRSATYTINVLVSKSVGEAGTIQIDGIVQDGKGFRLADDGKTHSVQITIAAKEH